MDLREIYSERKHNLTSPIISFEVYPPKDNIEKLYDELSQLKKYKPALVSVTSTSSATNLQQNEIVNNIKKALGFSVMPHLTCLRNSREEVCEYLTQLNRSDTECILALRGDFPTDGTEIRQDFKYANELVEFIKSQNNISIAVAGYPEGHIESPSLQDDIKYLKQKVNAGADAIYTQLFYDNDKLYKYIDLVCHSGIEKPIIAGIMPIINYNQIIKMTNLANITLPKKLSEKIERYKDDNKSMTAMGIEYTSKQCAELIKNEICGLHFYTLNKAHSVQAILDNIL